MEILMSKNKKEKLSQEEFEILNQYNVIYSLNDVMYFKELNTMSFKIRHFFRFNSRIVKNDFTIEVLLTPKEIERTIKEFQKDLRMWNYIKNDFYYFLILKITFIPYDFSNFLIIQERTILENLDKIDLYKKQILKTNKQLESWECEYNYLTNLNKISQFFRKNSIIDCGFEIEKLNKTNDKYEKEIKRLNEVNEFIKEYKIIFQNFYNKYNSTKTTEENCFIPLKIFFEKTQEDFIGCYIIKNIMNNKVYVGQSKHVLTRIKQHFDCKTLEPKNPIFIPDCLNLSEEQVKYTFMIAIVNCQTKDELDETEKFLIQKYDSFNKGYNRTAGNN